MLSNNELNIRLDDDTRDALDTYARRFFKKPDSSGNRSEAVRHLLTAIFSLQGLPQVTTLLDGDIVLNGDIVIFIRTAISEYLETLNNKTEHELE